jgi:phosphoribosylaminoimidazole-succinocarboxamide synthase
MKTIIEGKTKRILPFGKILGMDAVIFEQIGRSVNADGTSVTESDKKTSDLLIKYLVEQNHNMFSLLNNMGVATTYFDKGTSANPLHLLHEKCEPFCLEFVVRRAICNASSILLREPKKYGLLEDGTYSTTEANEKYFDEEGRIIPLDQPILEVFHKKCLVEYEDGSIDLISESEAKKNLRFFKDGKMTEFMHEDPLLISIDNGALWLLYDQKKELKAPIAVINRIAGKLFSMDNTFVRKLDPTEYVSKEVEDCLLQQTLENIEILQTACNSSRFFKAMLDENGVTFTDELIKTPFIIDGKMEYGLCSDGVIKLTDDLVSDNMRWAFGRKPNISLKRLFQNYESMEQKLLIAATIAEGTKEWASRNFSKKIKN